MAALYIFPDTNLLMHFRRIDELDWKRLSGAKDIVIVLAPTVVKELGKHKDQHPIPRLRDRARNLNSWLRSLRKSEDKRLKNGVTLQIATKEPTSFLGDDLDPADNDDRIIASARAYAHENRDVAVASDDTIMLHKLDAHSIRAVEIPEHLRLADEATPLEAENKKLRGEINAIKGRQPTLDLVWKVTHDHVAEIVVVPIDLGEVVSPDEMERRHPKMLRRGERREGALSALGDTSSSFFINNDAINRYNDDIAIFHRRYATYYEKVHAVAELRRRYIPLALSLRNIGHASATHIQVTLRFPKGMRVLENKPNLAFPKAPGQPAPFSPLGSLLERPITFPQAPNGPRDILSGLKPFDPFAAQIEDDGATVRWDRNRLLHGTDDSFEPLHCMFAEDLIGKAVEIRVELRAKELPEAATFALRATITARDSA